MVVLRDVKVEELDVINRLSYELSKTETSEICHLEGTSVLNPPFSPHVRALVKTFLFGRLSDMIRKTWP